MDAGAGQQIDLERKAREFDRDEVRGAEEEREGQRRRVLSEFPQKQWLRLPLERYALGPDSVGSSFCRVLEYGTDALGSIRGGSAAKHIIYQHNTGEWRYPAPLGHLDEQEAWRRIRAEFVMALEMAGARDFRALDDLGTLSFGQAMVTKALSVYYPHYFLPIFSAEHVRHFTALLDGIGLPNQPGVRTWTANRYLYRLVQERPEFDGWSPFEVMRFLYTEFDPRIPDGDVWKIAPGAEGQLWPEFREDGCIRVGWGEVGDLGQYESDRALKQVLDGHRPGSAGHNLRLARQLLEFRDLEPGEQIVANRGKSEVLALGTVTGGYVYDDFRPDYPHRLAVDWDTSYAQYLDSPVHAWQQTFAKVPDRLLRQIRSRRRTVRDPAATGAEAPAPQPPAEPPAEVRRVLEALDHKGQVILQGPPGTGKTRLALSTALALADRVHLIDAGPAERAAAVAELLALPQAPAGTGPAEQPPAGRLTMVTFHPSYGYEDFVEGFKPVKASGEAGLRLDLREGLFRRVCRAARDEPDETFLLIIDEINRGDLPRILGELITLLELDKRGIPVTLPISEEQQAVPPNVRIIGTMNSADRSTGHLDAAIRRRFATIEVPPDPEAVAGNVGGLELADLLGELNVRLYETFGPDQVIGQAALMREDRPVATPEELAAAFRHDIVPLVDDHCLGRPEQLRAIFGSLADPDTGRIAWSSAADLPALLAAEFTPVGRDDTRDA
ncbi:AAA family ATPase [Kitasatospora sp. NPDC088391]|uniref:AAA family ATPase n=1 Tax=Kitasatospora sp. NPDC088391 TaxID=3364074 RepID=UPI00380222C1